MNGVINTVELPNRLKDGKEIIQVNLLNHQRDIKCLERKKKKKL